MSGAKARGLCRRSEPRPQVGVECKLHQGVRESAYVAGLREALAPILRQVRKVPARQPTTGRPKAIASPQTVPYDSREAGSTKTSAAA